MPKTATRQKIAATKKVATAAPAVAETEAAETPACAHHWVIASPNGEMSVGRCKVCGAEKEFPNSAEDYLWERSVPQSRWTGRADAQKFNDGF
jgi:hypothetical protein